MEIHGYIIHFCRCSGHRCIRWRREGYLESALEGLRRIHCQGYRQWLAAPEGGPASQPWNPPGVGGF